jgi:hypothetical protein
MAIIKGKHGLMVEVDDEIETRPIEVTQEERVAVADAVCEACGVCQRNSDHRSKRCTLMYRLADAALSILGLRLQE